MIVADLSQAERYEALHPLFKELFAYMRQHDLTKVPDGRINLKGEELFINVDDAQMQPAEERRLEVHRKYIDIQFPLSASEVVGWKALSDVKGASDAPFDEARDIAFYTQPAAAYFEVRPGQFYLLYPEDAHAPLVGEGPIRKAIAKVRIDGLAAR